MQNNDDLARQYIKAAYMAVQEVLGLSESEIKSKRKNQKMVTARCLISYLCRTELYMEYADIGLAVNRSRVSAFYECNAFGNCLHLYEKSRQLHKKVKTKAYEYLQKIQKEEASGGHKPSHA